MGGYGLVRARRWRLKEVYWWMIAALAVRVAFTVGAWPRLPAYVESDAVGYHKSAINLLHNHVFSESPSPPLYPISFRTPGYPMFLAGLYALGFEGRPQQVALAQDALGALLVGLIWLMGMRLSGKWTARVAAGLTAFDPATVALASFLLTETLFTLVLCGALWFVGRALEKGEMSPRGRLTMAGAGSALLGLAPLVRPVALPLLVVGFPFIAAAVWRALPRGGARRWASIVGAGLVLALPSGAWMARNWRVFGDVYFCEAGAFNLYVSKAMRVKALAGEGQLPQLYREALNRFFPQLYQPRSSPAELQQQMMWLALDVFRGHPKEFLRLEMSSVKGLIGSPTDLLWTAPVGLGPAGGNPKQSWLFWVSQAERAVLWLALLGALTGAAVSLIRWRSDLFPLLLVATFFCLAGVAALSGAEAYPRLRAGYWPVEALVGAHGLSMAGQAGTAWLQRLRDKTA